MPKRSPHQAAAQSLMKAAKVLDQFTSGKFGKVKFSEQWLDELGDGLEEIAQIIDPEAKSLVLENDRV